MNNQFKYRAKIKNKFQRCGLRGNFKTIEETVEYAKEEQLKPQFSKYHTIEIYECCTEGHKNIEKFIMTVE